MCKGPGAGRLRIFQKVKVKEHYYCNIQPWKGKKSRWDYCVHTEAEAIESLETFKVLPIMPCIW